MQWTPEQENALRQVKRWQRDKSPDCPQIFRLFGFAGTGKTTLAKFLTEDADGEWLFAAYTGKAAHVLRTKGCTMAKTIHLLIYKHKPRSQRDLRDAERLFAEKMGRLEIPEDEVFKRYDLNAEQWDLYKRTKELRLKVAQPAFEIDPESDLADDEVEGLVVDECSMVGDRMAQDLLSFKKKILVLGDPAQLPPVKGTGYFTDAEPDIMLTDIQRQAKENPIIAIATTIRERQRIPDPGVYGSSVILQDPSREQLGELAAERQILVGKNKTRAIMNARCREVRGFKGVAPVIGDRVICLKNDHQRGLLNGALFDVHNTWAGGPRTVWIEVESADGTEMLDDNPIEAHLHHFEGKEGPLFHWAKGEGVQEFDYAYAITVHKSQGSQFDDVLLFDQSRVFRHEHWRWAYTGVTRAANRIAIVKGY